MFDKQHTSSVQCITPPNRFSAPVNQNKSVAQQAVTSQHWPVSELKVTVSGGSTRGNSPKSKLVSEGIMSPILSIFRNGFSKVIPCLLGILVVIVKSICAIDVPLLIGSFLQVIVQWSQPILLEFFLRRTWRRSLRKLQACLLRLKIGR